MDKSVFYSSDPFRRRPVKYIKSPLNYVGGKYKLLSQIMPLFPHRIETFADLFAGGCNVAVNVEAQHYLCNDLNTPIVELFETFRSADINEILRRMDENIARYKLTKQNEEGFLQLRAHYNETRDPLDLYTLTCYSFNYQFRFNSRLEYNNPFGRDRSHFSDRMRKNLAAFVQRIQEMDVEFTSMDFTQVSLDRFTPADFLYCDPPYLITTGSYNDGNRGFSDWRKEQEVALCDYLDRADARGLRFALSNVLVHKGKVNDILMRWSKKYRVVDLYADYSNSSYHTERSGSREVLIVNYGVDNGNFINTSLFG